MKHFLFILTLFLVISGLGQAQSLEKLYTEPGYPYGELVRRSEQVRLSYHPKGQQISCSAEIHQGDRSWRGQRQLIDARDFDKAPFEACLDRGEAKAILGQLVSQS
ncbi:hypothetical protein [Bowmanella dokdonensis]|uniref:Uncharacterized protein n=1 Tax=Bowmanella dokdonensis TaxID=751969 RepID=A0A939DLN5_9ALTE|nr:hypothetical protein [Bowmanella dokdonensis]MBN7825033.1 hypothetical protein [Bowmanella dokdonensis]